MNNNVNLLNRADDNDVMLPLQPSQRTIIANVRTAMANHREALGSVAALSGGHMFSSLLGILGGLLVARFLGPAETGLFRSFTIPLMYLTFLHIGTFDGLYRQIPFYVGKEMPEKVRALASAAGAWNVMISTILSSVFIVLAFYGAWHHNLVSTAGWLSQALFCWGVFYSGYLGATYRTIHQFVMLARRQVVQAVTNFMLVFSLPYLGFYGLCLRSACSSMVGTWLLHRNRPLKVRYRFDKESLKEVVRIGLPFSVWGSLYTSVWTATESALMVALGGVTGLGLFAIAVVLRDGMNILPQAVNQVIMPRMVEAFAREGSVRKSNVRLFWLTAGLSGFMLLLAIAVALFLDVFVPFALPKYVEGIPLMKVCLGFVVIQAASLPLTTIFAAGRPWMYGRGIILGMVVFPLATYLLIPAVGGILAVASGSLLGRLTRTIAAYVEIGVEARRESVR